VAAQARCAAREHEARAALAVAYQGESHCGVAACLEAEGLAGEVAQMARHAGAQGFFEERGLDGSGWYQGPPHRHAGR
jgi:hypothetical protein